MKAMNLLIAVFAIVTQGCAATLQNATPEYGTRFGEIRSDRPSVTDQLKGGQTAVPGFGSTPNHRSVPSSLPLPVQANPRATFAVPSLGKHTISAFFGGVGVAIEVGCALSALSEYRDYGCEYDSMRDFEKNIPRPASNKGPIILR